MAIEAAAAKEPARSSAPPHIPHVTSSRHHRQHLQRNALTAVPTQVTPSYLLKPLIIQPRPWRRRPLVKLPGRRMQSLADAARSARWRNRFPQGRICWPGMASHRSLVVMDQWLMQCLAELSRSPIPLNRWTTHITNRRADSRRHSIEGYHVW